MKIINIILASFLLLICAPAFANGDHANHLEHKEETAKNTIKMEIEQLPHVDQIDSEDSNRYLVKLTDIKTGKPINENNLKIAHTRKLHLLVIDPSLSDYHHLHPVVFQNTQWSFGFTSLKNTPYRVWADVTREDTGKQEYVIADIGTPTKKAEIDKTEKTTATIGEYSFTLALDGEAKVGEAVMASIKVSKNGKPFTELEPVMGAFAHVVGFGEDYKSIMHIHPMGKEPETEDERGGDELMFHIEPKTKGFVKLFAQFKIAGKDVFVPFGIMVK